MTYGEFCSQVANRFVPDLSARLKVSVSLAQDIAAMPDGTVTCEVVGVERAFGDPDLMVLTLEAV